jgi:hypothetical protein
MERSRADFQVGHGESDPEARHGTGAGEQLAERIASEDGEPAEVHPRKEGDVVLRVPHLSTEEISIDVDHLDARLSLGVGLGDFLRIDAGVDVSVDSVDITIKGVQAEAHLRVYLDEIARIIDRVMRTIEQNPEIFREVLHGASGMARAGAETIEEGRKGHGLIRKILPGGGDGDGNDDKGDKDL